MGGEIAENAGKISGTEAGKAAGALAGEKVALEAVMQKAIEAATEAGQAEFGEIGAKVGKEAGEAAAKEIAIQLGRLLGGEAGEVAGALAGAKGAKEAGEAEAAKHNVLDLNATQVDELKMKLAEIGTSQGKIDGEAAGTEAGLKIDIPRILDEAIKAAKSAAISAVQVRF